MGDILIWIDWFAYKWHCGLVIGGTNILCGHWLLWQHKILFIALTSFISKMCLILSPPTLSHHPIFLSCLLPSALYLILACQLVLPAIPLFLFYLLPPSPISNSCLLPHKRGKTLINYPSYLPWPPVITQISSPVSFTQHCTWFWLVWVRLINYYIIITQFSSHISTEMQKYNFISTIRKMFQPITLMCMYSYVKHTPTTNKNS